MNVEDCKVNHNCICNLRGQDKCWLCEDYKLYLPQDIKIKSPAQLRKKEERKAEKKMKKQTDASKRGRASKKKGYRGENEIVHLLEKYGIEAKRQPLSGALKGNLGGDITAKINNRDVKIESKRRADGFKEDYKYIEQDNCNYVFKRADRKGWLVTMTFEEFLLLLGKEGA